MRGGCLMTQVTSITLVIGRFTSKTNMKMKFIQLMGIQMPDQIMLTDKLQKMLTTSLMKVMNMLESITLNRMHLIQLMVITHSLL